MILQRPRSRLTSGRVEANLSRLQTYADEHKLRNRSHAQAHKLPLVTHMQVWAGSVGIVCWKLKLWLLWVFATFGSSAP